MTFQLTPSAQEWQAKLRDFVDRELIPWEVEAEMNGGVLPAETSARHKEIALAMGLSAMDVPVAHGGLGLAMLDQAAVWEQLGRVTNALGWCFPEVHGWMLEACSAAQIATYIRPLMAGQRHECYAITEEGPGSDVESLEATARPDGDDYLLSGEKWYVTSANLADFCFFQAKLAGGPESGPESGTQGSSMTGLFFASTWTAPASRSCARRRSATPSPRTTRSIASRTCACRRPTWSARRATV